MKALYLISLFLLSLTNISIAELSASGVSLTIFMLVGLPVAAYYYAKVVTMLPRVAFPGLLYLLLYVLLISTVYIGASRWSSVAYTAYFVGVIGFFFWGRSLVSSGNFVALTKLVMLAYLANVAISFILYDVVGRPLLTNIFQVYDEGWRIRFQAFASEPSYAAIIVNIACFAYLRISNEPLRSKALWIFLCLLQVVLFDSVFGYVLILLNGYWFSKHTPWRRIVRVSEIIAVVFVAVAIIYTPAFWGQTESRMGRLLLALVSGGFNLDVLRAVDSSAFMRVGPIFRYIESGDYFSLAGIFGHGPGAAAGYFGGLFSDAIGDQQWDARGGMLNLGFLPGFVYDYGIVGALLVWIGILKAVAPKFFSRETLLLLLVAVNANFNTQLFCYAVVMLYLTTCYATSKSILASGHNTEDQ